jgi:hypothetical protein
MNLNTLPSQPIQPTQPKVEDEKKEKVKVDYYVKFSFMITYILLLTTATVTFIEAMRTPVPHVRHIFNLETCISLVAGYFYSLFVDKINKAEGTNLGIDWSDISKLRYIDWSITTPFMLLVFIIVLSDNIKKDINIFTYFIILILNYLMLYAGYLGESQAISRVLGLVLGFIAFFAMFYFIYVNFVQPKYVLSNYIFFGTYLAIWSIYGIVYMVKEEYKNIVMNILDLTSKCFVGLGLWLFYTKILHA